MQYFQALKIGQRRSKEAAELLSKYVSNAMPAITLKDSKDGSWEPVGEENYVGIVKQDNGFMVCIFDKDGNAKAVAYWYDEKDANEIVARISNDGLPMYKGSKVKIPL